MGMRAVFAAMFGRYRVRTEDDDIKFYEAMAEFKAMQEESEERLHQQHQALEQKQDDAAEMLNQIVKELRRGRR